MTKPTYEQLLNGEVNQVSILNEPIDYSVDYSAPKLESASEIAKRRWFKRDESKHERE